MIPVQNPASGSTLARVPDLDTPAVQSAIDAAQHAFGPWAARTADERASILMRWHDLMLQHQEDLARIMTAEQGKPLAEARGEIGYAASFVRYFAEEGRRVAGEVLPSHRGDARILTLRQPVGVVAAITPWNFPAAMITRKAAPALAVGCTMVCKPARETPLSALALAALAERAGMPPGVFNVVTGSAGRIGQQLCDSPVVRALSFTGSTEIGKLLMRQAASTVKRLGLEFGGNAPFIVFDDADLDAAVEGAMQSKFRNMGQTCVCANRLYVQSGVYERFSQRLVEAARRLKVGPGDEEGVTQGPLINAAAIAKVEEHVADARERGARVLLGGRRHSLGDQYYEPTVISEVPPDALLCREEVFGPVAPLVRFEDEEQLLRLTNDTPFGTGGLLLYSRPGSELACGGAPRSRDRGSEHGTGFDSPGAFRRHQGVGGRPRGIAPRGRRVRRHQVRADGGSLNGLHAIA